MENRRPVLVLILFLVFGLFLADSQIALGYGVETHGYLTKVVVDFYNQHFSNNKISEEDAAFLIDGARLEDNVPRYFNHFYDPINNRGLADKIYRGMASKLWAQNPKEQLALIYRILPQTQIPTLLTASQIQVIKPDFDQSDFTWQKAIELYAKGEKEKAFFALGHTLHLIEDASVPDHTRNDSHPPFDDGGSPYENWTGKFSLKNFDFGLTGRLKNKKPILLNNLDEYFDGIANYSNNNFYSKDTINNYNSPKPDYFTEINGEKFGMKKDSEFGNYKLVVGGGDFEWSPVGASIAYPQILNDYWSRLSTKAVQYGAGVVNLFFKEAEAARQQYLTEKAQRPFLGQLVDGFKNIFGGGETKDVADLVNEFKKVDEIPITNRNNESGIKNQEPLPPRVAPPPAIETEIVPLQLQSVEPIAPPPTEPEFTFCPFGNSSATPQNDKKVVINEVAWMGSANSANDEWIELKNISSGEVDLTDWQILDLGEQIKIQLNGKIPAGGFHLLERTDDDSVSGIPADQIYKGALANVGEGLRLFSPGCVLVDEVMAAPDWPAGDNNYKYTMERNASLSAWLNYNGTGQNGIYGTPKAENSPGTVPINYSSPALPAPTPPPVIATPSGVEEEVIPTVPTPKILISEILFDAEGSDGGKEFIELYNPNDTGVDLSTWSIQHVSASGSLTKKNFEAGNTIGPKGFFLIGLGADPRADLTWSSGSLNNTSATIYLAGNTDPISTTSPTAVDITTYDVVNLSGFTAGQSLERKALENNICASARGSGEFLGNGCNTDSASDWELRAAPNPQNTQSLPEPRPAPAAVTNFQISYSSTTSELSFAWDSNASVDKYHLVEINPTSAINATTTENQANSSVSATGVEYKFEIYSVDKDGLYSSPTAGSVFVPEPAPEPEPEPGPESLPTPEGISNIIFSRDDGGNFIGFTLNDTNLDSSTIHYILVWFNEDPKEMSNAVNRSSGLVHNWANPAACPSTGIVEGNGGSEAAGGTGFDNYVMPGYEPANKPPIYDPEHGPYNYKVYFTETCPGEAIKNERDLKGELTSEDFITMGLWYYYVNMGIIDEARSINYPQRIYFSAEVQP